MAKAIRINQYGGPEVLELEEVEIGAPGPGQARIRHTAIGLNMADTYRRSGAYPVPLPFTPGSEGAGVVVALDDGVTGLKAGDRVAYAGPVGSYAEERLIAADKLVPLPDGITDQQAAAMMLKGLTVHYLIHWTYAVQPGDAVLIHAAAGGVGLIFCQWAKHLGATVIGTVGTPEKGEIARAHGCDHALPYGGFGAAVKDITGGAGCAAVYDSIGKETIVESMQCLRPRGVLSSFGQSSGPYGDLDTSPLRSSRFFTRSGLPDYTATREDLTIAADRLFDIVGKGIVRIEVNQTYALADAAQSHRDLEARKTTGSTVLLP